MKQDRSHTALIGSLLGTAVGDALGLPCEALSKARQKKMYPSLEQYGFLFGKGMCSDDTEHACMTVHALTHSQGEPNQFARLLAWQLRWWFMGLPAGIGLATLKSCLKLWLGFGPHHSGVYSAGNGPAMRAAVIGVMYGQEPELMSQLIHVSSTISHTDPKAEHGALAIALAAYLASLGRDVSPEEYASQMRLLLPNDSELFQRVEDVCQSVQRGECTEQFAKQIGCKEQVSGYMLHTVPIVLHVWLNHQADYKTAIHRVIRLGGDTDTTAAILGGIIGARVGRDGIPACYLNNLLEWPRTVQYIENLALQATRSTSSKTKLFPLFTLALLLRNLCFMIIVLWHGFRRLLPPYE